MWVRVSKGAEVWVGGWVDIVCVLLVCVCTYVCVHVGVCMGQCTGCLWPGAQRFRVYRLCWGMGCSENVLSL